MRKSRSTQATIEKYQNDETRYKERLEIASEVEGMRTTLAQHGTEFASQSSWVRWTRKLEAAADVEFEHNSLIEAQHQLDGFKADRAAFVQQWSP